MLLSLSPLLLWIQAFAQGQPPAVPEATGELAGLARGDHNALAEFVKKHEAWARRFVARAIGDEDDAEDIVQEAFLSLWRQAPALPPSTEPSRWLLMVITRRSADYRRKKRPMPCDELPEKPDSAPSPRERASLSEERENLARLIALLDPRQRTALILTLEEGLSMREGAEMMEMSQKAFESLLHRARQRLASLWKENES